jgi:flavodoxin
MKKLFINFPLMAALFLSFFICGLTNSVSAEKMAGENVLVVYYSLTGNTELVAKTIADEFKGELRKIEEVKDRGKGFKLYFFGGFNASMGKCSELKPADFDIKKYDLVFIGSPVWGGRTVPAINTFIEKADFADKKVILFFTMGSKSAGNAAKKPSGKIEKKGGKVIGWFGTRSEKGKQEEMIENTKKELEKIKSLWN